MFDFLRYFLCLNLNRLLLARYRYRRNNMYRQKALEYLNRRKKRLKINRITEDTKKGEYFPSVYER